MTDYQIQMKGITKHFGKVTALKDVDFDVGSNEVVGLVGDNGAGKSTLIKILTGVFPPDKGEIIVRGKKVFSEGVKGYSVSDAHELSIETVFQDQALGSKQPLWRNMFAGREPKTQLGTIDLGKAKEETERILRDVMGFTGGGISPDSVVATLSGGERQGVAIGRALYFDADLIILDEPTTALSIQESKKVEEFVERIKEEGKSGIYISHNMQHTYPVSDRFVLLEKGGVVGEYDKDEVSQDELSDVLIRAAGAAG